MNATNVTAALQQHAKPEDAIFLQRFFKTGPGQYGEGDVFIGVRVPQARAICKAFAALPLPEVQQLLNSDVHEYRLAGLMILTYKYPKANEADKAAIYDLYLKNVRAGRVNNWDLVDVSADKIVGPYLQGRSLSVLDSLAKNKDIWQRRVAMISTFHFLKYGDPAPTLHIAELLLHDQRDLIQKAVGWMLREMGKKIEEKLLTDFLEAHYRDMPRTMLRYAIERLSAEQKAYFMHRG